MRRQWSAVLLLAACAPAAPPAPRAAATIDTLALRAHTWFLSHDALRGRGSRDPVILHAARYLVAQCLALGLEPVGKEWFQAVPTAGPAAVNVGCLLRGRDPALAGTAIAFTAHYDHLGIDEPVAGDSIYNGFSDNAAGVAMLLAIAQALRQPELAPRHSVLLLFFTAEERGLLGSRWWVEHPLWPLARIAAVINLDAGAPPGRPRTWRVAGGEGSWLGALAREVAATRGWTASVSAARANSDYHPFHRLGIAAVFPIPGPGPYEGLSADSSDALRRRWDRYHQPGDEWFADFPFAGVARYAEYALAIALAVDRRSGTTTGAP
jgi:hypothetical protein